MERRRRREEGRAQVYMQHPDLPDKWKGSWPSQRESPGCSGAERGGRSACWRVFFFGLLNDDSAEKGSFYCLCRRTTSALPQLSGSIRVSTFPRRELSCHRGPYTEYKLRQKRRAICLRCLRRRARRDELNGGAGEQRARGRSVIPLVI